MEIGHSPFPHRVISDPTRIDLGDPGQAPSASLQLCKPDTASRRNRYTGIPAAIHESTGGDKQT
jgi:hypothetical protein